jgi:2-methylisocitrate lyase-like PEP mutase family enzyme
MPDALAMCERFRQLHERQQVFLIPNPWDVGSARLLESLGFEALATTSSGLAASLGRLDMSIGRDAVVAHVAALTAAIDIPLNVDSERCYAETLDGIAETATQLAQAGAAGFSIEDWKPAAGTIDPIGHAAERVAAVVEVAHLGTSRLMVTARAENFLRGFPDIDDTVGRLIAYRDAGADVVYAPGLTDLSHIKRVVDEVELPVNVILLPNSPTPRTRHEHLHLRRCCQQRPAARVPPSLASRNRDARIVFGTHEPSFDLTARKQVARGCEPAGDDEVARP